MCSHFRIMKHKVNISYIMEISDRSMVGIRKHIHLPVPNTNNATDFGAFGFVHCY